jgi:hypothetical protein
MANSAVDICNSALILVGAERINSLSDANRPARICNEIFDTLRDQLIALHPWNFAIKRATLAQIETNPVYDYSYAHALPQDVLRVIDTNLGDSDWAREGNTIVSNYTDVKIKYIAKVTDISKWSEGFKESLSHKMAVYLAYSLVQSTSLSNALKQDYITVLRNAKSQDAQEHGLMVVDADEWINSRY